jgi:hypothetical protein
MESSLRFRLADGIITTDARAWLSHWAARYPRGKYPSISHLIAAGSSGSLSSQDFEWIGKWKDGAFSTRKWKPNIASVAYPIWMQASSQLPGIRITDDLAAREFLIAWTTKTYRNFYRNGLEREPKFGLSRASTLLHLVSGGNFPIFDSNVRRAVKRLTGRSAKKDDIEWYLCSYRQLFQHVMDECKEIDVRRVDEALFSFGNRDLTNLDKDINL